MGRHMTTSIRIIGRRVMTCGWRGGERTAPLDGHFHNSLSSLHMLGAHMVTIHIIPGLEEARLFDSHEESHGDGPF